MDWKKNLQSLAKRLQAVDAINTAKEAIYNRVSLGYYSSRVEGGEGEESFLYYMTHILWCVVFASGKPTTLKAEDKAKISDILYS